MAIATGTTAAQDYQAKKERERRRQALNSLEGRDIFPIPDCQNPALREAVTRSFKRFAEVCFPRRFSLGWSKDHLDAIAKIEKAIREGDLFALAMPRGNGKTTLAVVAVIWAVLCGYRRYVVLIGANKSKAAKLLNGLKKDLETNKVLMALFPEVCYPIRRLEGKGNKATGQLYDGVRTHIEWTGTQIVLAHIDGIREQSVLEVVGLTGDIRGGQYTTASGEVLRPDFFILDDPQTDKTAKSKPQNQARLDLINGAVLGLAGPDETITGFALVTVIEKDDMADQLLCHERNPSWQGTRAKMVYKWPDRLDLWQKYAEILKESIAIGRGIELATDYYKKNRAEMDAGSVVGWVNRFRPKIGEISAIQCAWNLRIQSDKFWSEYQNEPQQETIDLELLDVGEIESKINGYERGVLPFEANLITAAIDVQSQLLYYVVCAWDAATFTGWVLDYGSFPEQPGRYFTLRKAESTLSKKYPGTGLEGRIRAGLFDLIDLIAVQRKHLTLGGKSIPIQSIGIDAAWGEATRTIEGVAIEHPYAANLIPTFGRGIGPKDKPMKEWAAKPGDRKGENWFVRPNDIGGRHMVLDANFWKSFVHARLKVATGDKGSLSLYKRRMQTEHRLFAEHLRSSETPRVEKQNGRSITVWKHNSSKPDNHFFDCLSNAAALASACGAKLSETDFSSVKRRQVQPKPRRPIIFKH